MAFPLALPALATAGRFLAGLLAKKAVQGAALNTARQAVMHGGRAFGAGQAVRTGLATGARMAGTGLQGTKNFLVGDMGKGELLARLVPEGIGAGVTYAVTPGDWSEKGIGAATQFFIPAAAGMTAAKLGMGNQLASNVLDIGGSIAGSFAAMPVEQELQRAKNKLTQGEYKTAYELMNEEQQKLYAQQMEQQFLESYGLLPGVRPEYIGVA